MNITKQTIDHIAKPARLPITADAKMCEDICRIIEYMDTVPAETVEEAPPDLHSVLREDEAGECIPHGELCRDAFTVPRTVE